MANKTKTVTGTKRWPRNKRVLGLRQDMKTGEIVYNDPPPYVR